MKPIIEKIANEKNVSYTMEESSWFNGHMTNPVKTYLLNYKILNGQSELKGEYRRNTWLKANWRKNIYETDIYLWSISMRIDSKDEIQNFEISKATWFERKIFGRPNITVKCKSIELKDKLFNSSVIKSFLAGEDESADCMIQGRNKQDGFYVTTNFNSMLDHELVTRKAMKAFEEIEMLITK